MKKIFIALFIQLLSFASFAQDEGANLILDTDVLTIIESYDQSSGTKWSFMYQRNELRFVYNCSDSINYINTLVGLVEWIEDDIDNHYISDTLEAKDVIQIINGIIREYRTAMQRKPPYYKGINDSHPQPR